MPHEFGDNEFSIEEIQRLFSGEGEQETPPAKDETDKGTEPENQDDTNGANDQNSDAQQIKNIDTTKAFSERLRKSTEKAVSQERENIAKTMGYESYDAMIKQREANDLRDKGLDPEKIAPVVDEMVQKRINADPRMAELERYRKQELKNFATQELKELSELTDGKISKLEDVPQPVLERWSKTGSLTSAYMAVEGVNFVKQIKSREAKGGTSHLTNPEGAPPASDTGKRHMTDEEKRAFRLFMPNITDEELNKRMVNK